MIRTVLRTKAFLIVSLVATSGQAEPPRENGLRGRLIVAPELRAAKEWPVDDRRADALRTAANVRRASGRPRAPMTEELPAISVVVDGEDVRNEPAPERTMVIEGMRFVPGQILLPRPGPIKFENKQGQPVTIVDENGKALGTVAAGATEAVAVPEGRHELSMKELPYARASVTVLSHAKVLPVEADGTIPLVDVPSGEYTLAFYLGAAELRTQKLTMPGSGLLFIDATLSANRVVDVTVKDASIQIAVPVGGP
jgi:hypothetical protein